MKTLELAGFSATRARDGCEGLKLALEESRFNLVVLDVMLPDMSGFEVCQRLREAGSNIPVIFLTAADSVGDKVRGLVIGGDDYLTKPFSGTHRAHQGETSTQRKSPRGARAGVSRHRR